MIYAPVGIPTLCRVEHLKRLINSLKKNSWAKYTELYIGIDYPPDERCEKGYLQICEYLDRGIDGFLKVNTFFHKENLGSYENGKFLKRKMKEKYDRYIMTEDDNIFSPNFLEYMDKMLDYYESDSEIIAIGGHNPLFETNISKDALLKVNMLYDGWGEGCWVRKTEEMDHKIDIQYLENILKRISKSIYLRRKNRNLFYELVNAIAFRKGAMFGKNEKLYNIDQVLSIYMIDTKKYMICPVYSKVRNTGDDGTGEHGGNDNKWGKQEIDNGDSFDISANMTIIDERKIKRQLRKKFYWDWYMNLESIFVWVIWNICKLVKK